MDIEFGYVQEYDIKRGFGYVSRTFVNSNRRHRSVWFHIKKVKHDYPNVAQELDAGSLSNISFWYEFDSSDNNRIHVSKIWLDIKDIPDEKRDNLVSYIEQEWRISPNILPQWLDSMTLRVVGEFRRNELKQIYDELVRQRDEVQKQEHLQEKNSMSLRRTNRRNRIADLKTLKLHYKNTKMEEYITSAYDVLTDKEIQDNGNKLYIEGMYECLLTVIDMYKKIIELEKNYEFNFVKINDLNNRWLEEEEKFFFLVGMLFHEQGERHIKLYSRFIHSIKRRRPQEELTTEEKEEVLKLVQEVSPFGFTYSSELSQYIFDNKLGYKYQKIAGILEMKLNNETWDFDGGISPEVYGILCDMLGLINKASGAEPNKFTPYSAFFNKH